MKPKLADDLVARVLSVIVIASLVMMVLMVSAPRTLSLPAAPDPLTTFASAPTSVPATYLVVNTHPLPFAQAGQLAPRGN